jgi:phosphate/sulfate permease
MDIYIFFVVVLFCLAISDLMVGVANDAINFLNSALGSKVAPRYVILIIASIGILAGAIFSNGMMEVARKGLFHPQYFLFTEIILLFMAVMFTDVLLLDFFNTFGLPTSTTVSLVFGILGAAVGVAIIKVNHGATIIVDGIEKIANVGDFINSSKALAIISSILLSVVFSFIFGIIVQWISRLIFSFNIEKSLKYFGSLWSGAAIAAITYFILIKGLKDASFMSPENYAVIQKNTTLIIIASMAGWAIILQALTLIWKINPLKIVIFFGTFALALAFAGNDLVNFIGVPLAGFEAFKAFYNNGGNDLLMGHLTQNLITPPFFLILAGVIMVTTLWLSKKSRTVSETELTLSRQEEGVERFGSSIFARVLVGRVIKTGTFFSTIIPQPVIDRVSKRFDQSAFKKKISKEKNPPMFDMVRASVNLVVSSILIAVGTSHKLPLSTTYVTFMVAMSTSLVDGAWGRDSAVYRITGVFSVIGGWFMTGLAAFTVALAISIFITWAQFAGVIIMVAFALFAIYRTNILHKKRHQKKQLQIAEDSETISEEKIIEKCTAQVSRTFVNTGEIIHKTIKGLSNEDKRDLRQAKEILKELDENILKYKSNAFKTIQKLTPNENNHNYIQLIDWQDSIVESLDRIIKPIQEHIDNHHKPLEPQQVIELKELDLAYLAFLKLLLSIVNEKQYRRLDEANEMHFVIIEMMNRFRRNQIVRINNKEVGNRNTNLYFNLLQEVQKSVIRNMRLIKLYQSFISIK